MTQVRLCFTVLFLLIAQAVIAAGEPPIRISAWYWLNAAHPGEWNADFRGMRDMGFTDVILCWGLDAAAFGTRTADTHRALQLAERNQLGAYLMIWHPTHNSFPRAPGFEQVDIAGNHRFTFDTFNSKWRHSQWKQYLQKVAAEYKNEAALAGYVFDDSFEIGPIGHFGGPSGNPKDRIISYGAADAKLFGAQPPRSLSDPAWTKWVAARSGWWEDWARDTAAFIRDIDPNSKHELYLEDTDRALTEDIRNRVGVDFGRIARHFDAVGAYTYSPFDRGDTGAQVAAHTRDVLRRTREIVGPDKKIIYTFWVFNSKEERSPGVAKLPTVEQIRQIAEAALAAGIRHLDLYGYRIGDYAATEQTWPKLRPGTGPEYPIVGQFPGKFLYDRPQIQDGLRKLLHEIRQSTR